MELREEVKRGIIKKGCLCAFQFQGREALGCDSPEASVTGNLQRSDAVMRGYISGNGQVKQWQLLAREAGLSSWQHVRASQRTETSGTCATVLRKGAGKLVLIMLQRGFIWCHNPQTPKEFSMPCTSQRSQICPWENHQSNLLHLMVWAEVISTQSSHCFVN